MNDIREVYNKISNDFDDTRYRVWTCTSRFMDPLEKGLNGLEVGCGNGKNILYRKDDLHIKGIDICDKLVDICKNKNLDDYKDFRMVYYYIHELNLTCWV